VPQAIVQVLVWVGHIVYSKSCTTSAAGAIFLVSPRGWDCCHYGEIKSDVLLILYVHFDQSLKYVLAYSLSYFLTGPVILAFDSNTGDRETQYFEAVSSRGNELCAGDHTWSSIWIPINNISSQLCVEVPPQYRHWLIRRTQFVGFCWITMGVHTADPRSIATFWVVHVQRSYRSRLRLLLRLGIAGCICSSFFLGRRMPDLITGLSERWAPN